MKLNALKVLAVTAALTLPVSAFAQDTTDTATTDAEVTTVAETEDNDFDWGWLGLAGLLGLSGLAGRNYVENRRVDTTTVRR